MDAADVVKDIEANLIPDAVLIPAMVGEVSRAQQTGYTLVFVPAFRP
jgi:intracellular sulfur oxidation DsrE/DsrF family protein